MIELCVVITIIFILSMAGGHQLLQLLDRRAEFKIRANAMHQMATAVQVMHEHTLIAQDGGILRKAGSAKQLVCSPDFAGNLWVTFGLSENQRSIEAYISNRNTGNLIKTITVTP
jgi:type II secretory pathway pseudopilin PulG